MNKQLLNLRWADIDEKLSAFLKKYNNVSKRTQNELQKIFDSIDFTFEDLNKYISQEDRQRLEIEVDELDEQGLLNGYFGFATKNTMKRRKIKYIEMLDILITACYIKELSKLTELENNLFKEVSEKVYNDSYKEVQAVNKLNGKKTKKDKSILPISLVATVLSMPNSKGYIWKEYTEGNAEYNAGQIKRQLIINMQNEIELNIKNPEFQKIIVSQGKRYLNKKKDEEQQDKYSGMLDEEVTYIVNNVVLTAYANYGIKKVIFIAVEDEKTTQMCDSLNNKTFYINRTNKFMRYSAEANGMKYYKIKGLKSGINLPPINDHFHWCRSTIYPYE